MRNHQRAATPGRRAPRRDTSSSHTASSRTASIHTASSRAGGSRGGCRRGRGEDWAGIVRRITPRDRWLIRMLHEHGFLTTPQLVQLRFASLRMTQVRLRALHAMGVTDRFQPLTALGPSPMHHVLGPVGARIIAAEERIDLQQLGWRHDRALAAAHRHTLAHDTGTADLICALASTPGVTLTRWWSESRCNRYFGHHTRPDAYLALSPGTARPAGTLGGPGVLRGPAGNAPGQAGGVWWDAFLEYDTGTEALAVLAAKVHGYYRLAAATGITSPVLIWTTRPGREPGARTALAHTLRTLPQPGLVPIATATPRHTGGADRPDSSWPDPAGPVWLPLTPHTPPEDVRLTRLTLTELTTAAHPRHQPGYRGGRPGGAPGRPGGSAHGDPRDPRLWPSGNTGLWNGAAARHALDPWPSHTAPGEASHPYGLDAAGGVVDLPAPPPLPPTPPRPTSPPLPSPARSGRRRG